MHAPFNCCGRRTLKFPGCFAGYTSITTVISPRGAYTPMSSDGREHDDAVAGGAGAASAVRQRFFLLSLRVLSYSVTPHRHPTLYVSFF